MNVCSKVWPGGACSILSLAMREGLVGLPMIYRTCNTNTLDKVT